MIGSLRTMLKPLAGLMGILFFLAPTASWAFHDPPTLSEVTLIALRPDLWQLVKDGRLTQETHQLCSVGQDPKVPIEERLAAWRRVTREPSLPYEVRRWATMYYFSTAFGLKPNGEETLSIAVSWLRDFPDARAPLSKEWKEAHPEEINVNVRLCCTLGQAYEYYGGLGMTARERIAAFRAIMAPVFADENQGDVEAILGRLYYADGLTALQERLLIEQQHDASAQEADGPTPNSPDPRSATDAEQLRLYEEARDSLGRLVEKLDPDDKRQHHYDVKELLRIVEGQCDWLTKRMTMGGPSPDNESAVMDEVWGDLASGN